MVTTFLNNAMPFGERAAYALRMLLIGMGTVFASLAILWGVLVLFRVIVERSGRKKSAPAAPVPAPAAPAEEKAEEGELVAVITAAIAASMAAENGGNVPAFRVVSFRKINTAKRG